MAGCRWGFVFWVEDCSEEGMALIFLSDEFCGEHVLVAVGIVIVVVVVLVYVHAARAMA